MKKKMNRDGSTNLGGGTGGGFFQDIGKGFLNNNFSAGNKSYARATDNSTQIFVRDLL